MDEDYRIYAITIDELKVNKHDQLSFFNVDKLESATKSRAAIYQIYASVNRKRSLKSKSWSDGMNESYQALKSNNLMNSEAIRFRIFFNHAIKKGDSEYKVITEIFYYMHSDKTPIYYLTTFTTTSDHRKNV